MFRKLKEFLFGTRKTKLSKEWFQLSYQEVGLTSAIIINDFDSALSWCREHLYEKDLIHMYHHTSDGREKLVLTIKWEN